jgi:hypothetical protein
MLEQFIAQLAGNSMARQMAGNGYGMAMNVEKLDVKLESCQTRCDGLKN